MSASLREAFDKADKAMKAVLERYPAFLLTDQEYNLVGAIAMEDGRRVGRNTAGRVLFSRQDHAGALRQAEAIGCRSVSTGWFGLNGGDWPGADEAAAAISAEFARARDEAGR